MNKEDKELLLKDLCARLPYGVKCRQFKLDSQICTLTADLLDKTDNLEPYLRPLSSMTNEEKKELKKLCEEDLSEFAGFIANGHGLSHDGLYMFDKLRQLEFCLSHHFDFRGMIEKELALEAPEGMYKLIKKK